MVMPNGLTRQTRLELEFKWVYWTYNGW